MKLSLPVKILVALLILIHVQNSSLYSQVVPKSWLGHWSGKLQIMSHDSIVQQLDMALELLPKSDTSISYTIIYYVADTLTDRRPYELIVNDYDRGLYLLDEHNGVLIETRRYQNDLISMFEVMDTYLLVKVSFESDRLVYEIMVTSGKKRTESGGSSDDVPPVVSYPVFSYHRAVLTKN